VAQRRGVIVVPGPLLSADEGHRRPLRLSFASGIAAITEGVERLAGAWAAYQAAYVGARGGDAPTAVL
jgi:DNA-binding transcriptional MocR family regulator